MNILQTSNCYRWEHLNTSSIYNIYEYCKLQIATGQKLNIKDRWNPTYILFAILIKVRMISSDNCVAGGFQEVGCGQNCWGGSPGEGQVLTHVPPFTIMLQMSRISQMTFV